MHAGIAGEGRGEGQDVDAVHRDRPAVAGLSPGVRAARGGNRRAPRRLSRRALSLRKRRGDQARHDQATGGAAEDLAAVAAGDRRRILQPPDRLLRAHPPGRGNRRPDPAAVRADLLPDHVGCLRQRAGRGVRRGRRPGGRRARGDALDGRAGAGHPHRAQAHVCDAAPGHHRDGLAVVGAAAAGDRASPAVCRCPTGCAGSAAMWR